MGIVGPNGAGKSTLIKAMLGLVTPLTGTSEFFGESLNTVRNRVGYMPQSASVDWDFPTTVVDLATMGTYGALGWFRRPGNAERKRAMDALEQTGMQDFAMRQIGELSGGQKQRAFLARALVQAPDLYFMDEPFQGIDAKSQDAMIGVLKELGAQGKTVVIVHHHLGSVLDFCDHVTLLNKTIVASGSGPETFTTENIRATYDSSNGAETFLTAAE
ncbi:MAG: metal ABC transporter ATP-binding protein [Marinovum sp.]|nr:metal ABC transporter ATP-binding protein [Marinovum sp.]